MGLRQVTCWMTPLLIVTLCTLLKSATSDGSTSVYNNQNDSWAGDPPATESEQQVLSATQTAQTSSSVTKNTTETGPHSGIISRADTEDIGEENDDLGKVSEMKPKLISGQAPCSVFDRMDEMTLLTRSPLVMTVQLTLPKDDVPEEAGNASNENVGRCWMSVTGPEDMVLSVLLLQQSCDVQGDVRVVEDISGEGGRTWQSCQTMINPGADYLSPGNLVYIGFKVRTSGVYRAKVNIIVTDRPAPFGLHLRYISTKQGYIQNSGIHLHPVIEPPEENLFNYMDNLNIASHLLIPDGHVVLISVAFALFGRLKSHQLCDDRLELHQHQVLHNNHSEKVWTLCAGDQPRPTPTIIDKPAVTVRFKSGVKLNPVAGYLKNGCGVRLVFSFHQRHHIPSQLSDTKWNCSADFWSDLQHHFLCNLVTECAGGEDEEGCPYTLCGDHSVAVAGKCYSIHGSASGLSWHNANHHCSEFGGRLAAFKFDELKTELMRSFRLDLIIKSGHTVLVGVRTSDTNIYLYRNVYQWTDDSIIFHGFRSRSEPNTHTLFGCLYPFPNGFSIIYFRSVWQLQNECSFFPCKYICERQLDKDAGEGHGIVFREGKVISGEIVPPVVRPLNESTSTKFPVVWCPAGHQVHAFLALDKDAKCFSADEYQSSDCDSSSKALSSSLCHLDKEAFPVPFSCTNGMQQVPYTLVCDFTQHCQDNSDEAFCQFPTCNFENNFLCADKLQCLPRRLRCDKIEDCTDSSDETGCRSSSKFDFFQKLFTVAPPFEIQLDAFDGYPKLVELSANDRCNSTHFRCPVDQNCIQVNLRCNGVIDCLHREDEVDCDSYTCPGYYKCRGSHVCVHPQALCDSIYHCPQTDDERFCDLKCAENCTCFGHSFTCKQPFVAESFVELRYLNAKESGMKLWQLTKNVLLVYLNLAHCDITDIKNVSLPNLVILDLSNNQVELISANDLSQMKNLRTLYLSKNPLSALLVSDNTTHELKEIEVSHTKLTVLRLGSLTALGSLLILNISGSKTQHVAEDGYSSLPKTLRVLDARGCSLTTFPRSMFKGLDNLQTVHTDNFKLCCSAMMPRSFNLDNCHAPFDEISSCEDLLRSNIYRVPLWILANFAILGNTVSFSARMLLRKGKTVSGFGVFVLHLCLSDFLMGVYLVFIGVADRLYEGRYLWEDIFWRHSAACKMAGFVSMISCEVSAFIICLITVDRFLVLRFPFSRLRFGFKSAQIASSIAWALGCMLSVIPLLPLTSHWEFYSQTGICIPLPVTRNDFAGHGYSFGVMIALNFVLFMLIATGQMSVYATIQTSKMSDTQTSKKSQDATIARRLITIVLSDFFCWFPIGLLGLLASSGTPIPGEVNVAMAIFVLPLNSALNPFLYTLNMLQEHMQKRKEERLFQKILQHKDQV